MSARGNGRGGKRRHLGGRKCKDVRAANLLAVCHARSQGLEGLSTSQNCPQNRLGLKNVRHTKGIYTCYDVLNPLATLKAGRNLKKKKPPRSPNATTTTRQRPAAGTTHTTTSSRPPTPSAHSPLPSYLPHAAPLLLPSKQQDRLDPSPPRSLGRPCLQEKKEGALSHCVTLPAQFEEPRVADRRRRNMVVQTRRQSMSGNATAMAPARRSSAPAAGGKKKTGGGAPKAGSGVRLLVKALGIYVCFIYWGFVQERVTTTAYQPAAGYDAKPGKFSAMVSPPFLPFPPSPSLLSSLPSGALRRAICVLTS